MFQYFNHQFVETKPNQTSTTMRSTVLAFAILTVMVIIMSSSGRFDRKQSSSSMVEAGQKKKMRIAMALIHLLGRRNKMIVPFPIPIPYV